MTIQATPSSSTSHFSPPSPLCLRACQPRKAKLSCLALFDDQVAWFDELTIEEKRTANVEEITNRAPPPTPTTTKTTASESARDSHSDDLELVYHSPSSSVAGRTCCSIDRTPAASAAAAVVIEDQY
uniref:Uncharacterized protein n=1 Tax=Oryza rufipogon TaxID=4529 RepID=A0A0E0QZS3_ORYRU